MSGFSADWLLLREPADHAARSPEILARTAAFFAGRDAATIVDLGCGTGSTIRALYKILPAEQSWRLVDHDCDLLSAAQTTLENWADQIERRAPLVLRKSGRRLTISTEVCDLSREFPDFRGVDLVTASALLDLASADWISRLATAVSSAGAAFSAALTYDGAATWTPEHPLDETMRSALNAHQRTDKGFGPALGPGATEAARMAFSENGYRVEDAKSPWRLGAEDFVLRGLLAEGYASAARTIGAVDAQSSAEWLALRRERNGSAWIGHGDLFAYEVAPAPDFAGWP